MQSLAPLPCFNICPSAAEPVPKLHDGGVPPALGGGGICVGRAAGWGVITNGFDVHLLIFE